MPTEHDPQPPTPPSPAAGGDAASPAKKGKVDWCKVRRERDASIEAGTDCLAGYSNPDMLPYWAIVSYEYRMLPKTKAENAIMICVMSHAGDQNPSPEALAKNKWAGWCTASNATIAAETHTHVDYCRWTLRHLVRRGLLIKQERHRHPSCYRMVDKKAWLKDRAPTDPGLPTKAGETAAEAARMILWERTLDFMPDYPRALYEARVKGATERRWWESALDQLEDRIDRGRNPRMGAESLVPVRDNRAMFEDLYGRILAAAGRAPP